MADKRRSLTMQKPHDKKISNITPILLLSLSCILWITVFSTQVLAFPEVEITYTGNEGFLIEAEGKRIIQ